MAYGFGVDRYGQSYYGVQGGSIQCSALVLSRELYDILAGNTPTPISCFADVTVGGTPVTNIEEIIVERAIWNKFGTVHIGFHTANAAALSLPQNADLVVSAGVKFGSIVASQNIFVGGLDAFLAPSLGESRATLDGYDNSKRIQNADSGNAMQGDVATWLAGIASSLSMGANFRVIQRAAPVNILRLYSLVGFRDGLSAANALVSAYRQNYLFSTGLNELVILDPTTLAGATPLFALSKVTKAAALADSVSRYNQIPYSNYTGYARDFVTYQLTINPNGSSTVTSATVGSSPIVSGTYNDAADQAIYGIMKSPEMQNGICQTDAELAAWAATVADESQREKADFETSFNPFVDLGSVIQYESELYFVARVRHFATASAFWTTRLELWKL